MPYYRCGRCRKRRRLSRELWEYSFPPKCCGGVHWLLDMHRFKEWKGKTGAYAICRCSGAWWGPHKPGSTYDCCDNKRVRGEPQYWQPEEAAA